MAKVTVKQSADQTKAVPVEILASSIIAIADGVRKLRSGPLNDRALCLLIQHAAPNVGGRGYSQLSIKEIRAVFEGIDNLKTSYIKKPRERD